MKYFDLDSAATDHPLQNNPGEPDVNYVSVGGEIGYTSYYWNTRDGVGLTDGDWVGPTEYTGDVTAFPDGTKGFQISDADGKMTAAPGGGRHLFLGECSNRISGRSRSQRRFVAFVEKLARAQVPC